MQPGTSAPPNTPEALLGPSRPLAGHPREGSAAQPLPPPEEGHGVNAADWDWRCPLTVPHQF